MLGAHAFNLRVRMRVARSLSGFRAYMPSAQAYLLALVLNPGWFRP